MGGVVVSRLSFDLRKGSDRIRKAWKQQRHSTEAFRAGLSGATIRWGLGTSRGKIPTFRKDQQEQSQQ